MLEEKLRFYGRRKGRPLTKYQRELIETKLPTVSKAIDFSVNKPIWLEIGFGGGEHLAHQASLFPDVTFVGCEAFQNGVASILAHMEQGGQTNINIYHGDARQLISEIPAGTIEKVFILYPDPWPKTRHGKRRIIQVELMQTLLSALKNGGEIVIATDDDQYGDHITDVFAQIPEFSGAKTKTDQTTPPPNWIQTRYEARAKRLGNVSYYFRYLKG